MKKITSVFLIFIIVLTLLAGTASAAPPEYTGEVPDSFYAMLIDADSGKPLFWQNENEQIYPASTTKIMTTIVALENTPDLNEKITIPAECDWTNKAGDYSILRIRRGEVISMKDLLYGMMIVSGDDAAEAIAIKVGGSIDGFVDMMNAKAQELGMKSTLFANAGGLDKENPHVTLQDMATLTVYAMKNPEFRKIVSSETYPMPETEKQNARTITNTNKLLDPTSEFYYEFATGVKTGSTPKAGGCLVSSATKDGMNLICLVYGEKPSSKTQRWKISKELLQWGFDNWKTFDVSTLLGDPVQAQVQDYAADDSMDGLLEFKQPAAGTTYVTLPKDVAQGLIDKTDTLEAVPTYDKELTAPIAEDDMFGTVTYKSKATGEPIYSYNLVASRDILEETSGDTITPVITLPPTPPVTIDQKSDNTLLFIIVLVVVAGGLIVFLIIRMITARRKRHFNKRRRPHYSYRK